MARLADKMEGNKEISDETMDNNDEPAESDERFPNKLPKYLKINGLGYMRLRKTPAVLRYHNSTKKEGHEQQYSELLLFSNWRKEEEEFHPGNAKLCIEEYNKRKEMINDNKKAIYPGENTVDLIESLDIDVQGPAHIYDMLDGEGQQKQEDDAAVGPENDPEFESFGYTGNLAKKETTQFESSKYRLIDVPHEEEMKVKTLRLGPEQMNIVRKVIQYCKDIVRFRKNFSHKVSLLKLIVLGGAGEKFIKSTYSFSRLNEHYF